MSNKVPLTALSRELAALTGGPVPSYRALWTKIVNGELPAEQVNGRYFADPRVIAQKLGLTAERAAA